MGFYTFVLFIFWKLNRTLTQTNMLVQWNFFGENEPDKRKKEDEVIGLWIGTLETICSSEIQNMTSLTFTWHFVLLALKCCFVC